MYRSTYARVGWSASGLRPRMPGARPIPRTERSAGAAPALTG